MQVGGDLIGMTGTQRQIACLAVGDREITEISTHAGAATGLAMGAKVAAEEGDSSIRTVLDVTGHVSHPKSSSSRLILAQVRMDEVQ